MGCIKVLFIGDIVGRVGRRAIKEFLPLLHKKHKPDFVIANGENAAGGFGITPSVASELLKSDIDILTSGNHVWNKKEIYPYLDNSPKLLRPANYPETVPGYGYHIYNTQAGTLIGVINLEGRIFMRPLECPFRTAEKIIQQMRAQTLCILVDFHAEATSEKQALGWFLDGTVSALIGTHTHVPTADEKILPEGTAYITDVGMTGSSHSVIGFQNTVVIEKFLSQLPITFKVAKKGLELQGVIVEIDSKNGKAVSIRRIHMEK